jgi:hypothetical protein
MLHSDRWNPLGENEDITDIQTSSNVIITGTQKHSGKDDFWPRAEENLLKAFEFYFLETKLDQNTLTDIYKIIASGDVASLDNIFKGMPPEVLHVIMGHSDFDTTRKYYIHITEERKRNEMIKLYIKQNSEEKLKELVAESDMYFGKIVELKVKDIKPEERIAS